MEVIPESEIPKKQRKKKVMTEKMLLQLADARAKALEIKKSLKDNDDAKIGHAVEKIKKERAKPKKKEVIKKLAEDRLAAEDSDTSQKGEPPQTMEVKFEKTGKVIDLASEEAIEKIKEEEGTHPPENEPENEVKLELAEANPPMPSPSSSGDEKIRHRRRKKYDLDTSSDDSEEECKIVYVPKFKRKSKKAQKEHIPVQVNRMEYQSGVPPSLVEARNALGFIGGRCNYYR